MLQAQTYVNRLDAEGIPAHIIDGETGTALGYLGPAIGGIKVHVLPRDLERAQQILGEIHGDQTWGEAFADESEWACTRCDAAVPADHDVCWSCGTPRSADVDAAAPAFRPVPPDERTTGEAASRLADPVAVEADVAEPAPALTAGARATGLAIVIAVLAAAIAIAVGVISL